MNILGLLGKFLSRDENLININQDFCVRLKTPMAGCYECIDRCPDSSIKITDNDVKILENCSYCNACLHICPNSVFYVKKNELTDFGNGHISAGNIYYFCAKTEQDFKTAENKIAINKVNKIKCIYEIDDLDIISFIEEGKKLFFITGDCKSCNLKYFYNKKNKRINEIKKFLNAENAVTEININNFDFGKFLDEVAAAGSRNKISSIAKTADKQDYNGDDNDKNGILDRREFFKNSFKGFKNNAKKMIEDLSIEDLPLSGLYSEYIDLGSKNDKKNNKLLIERQKKLYLFLKENEELLPLLNIRLPKLNENCVFCSNCWELCPTGALIFKENSISLEPFLCTGCNLCRDICSFGAVRMYRAKSLRDVSGVKILLEQLDDEIL
ncbi:MAG: 4Fe-4S binding protein [bacterium]